MGSFWATSGSSGFWVIPDCGAEDLILQQETINHEPESNWEQELLAVTNQHRIQQGLPPLAPDEALIRIAREHSYDMAVQGFISHDQPSGNLKTRLTRAGYLYRVARENVASSRTISKAHEAFLSSPSHEGNITATDVTRIGIGIARYPYPHNQYLYITEVFASPRDEYNPSMAQNQRENRVQKLR
jgi:uncharacterized protein YkwD